MATSIAAGLGLPSLGMTADGAGEVFETLGMTLPAVGMTGVVGTVGRMELEFVVPDLEISTGGFGDCELRIEFPDLVMTGLVEGIGGVGAGIPMPGLSMTARFGISGSMSLGVSLPKCYVDGRGLVEGSMVLVVPMAVMETGFVVVEVTDVYSLRYKRYSDDLF